MSKFLPPKKLIKEIDGLFSEADQLLFIVSPFIKLDSPLKTILGTKLHNPHFEVVILYGKNEDNHSQSLGTGDLDFFKKFMNVRIYYNPDLHAKYYANESKSIITSLNLHSYSIANNIEVGVLYERFSTFSILGDNREDDRSFGYFEELLDYSRCVFQKSSKQESKFFGLIKGDIKTKVEIDRTSSTHGSVKKVVPKKIIQKKGFCIRTGIEIPYDLNRPFCKEAYYSWATYSNPKYPEKFCHYSGEPSHGKTSFEQPFLLKNEDKAIDNHNLIHDN